MSSIRTARLDGLFRVEWLGGCVERVFGLTGGLHGPGLLAHAAGGRGPAPVRSPHHRLALGQSSDLILRARHQDGSLRHLRSCAVVDRGEAGHGAGQLYGALQDVSRGCIRAEAALRETLAEAERFRVALDHAPSYVYIKDAQGRYVYGNRAALELFDCTGEALCIGGGLVGSATGKASTDTQPVRRSRRRGRAAVLRRTEQSH